MNRLFCVEIKNNSSVFRYEELKNYAFRFRLHVNASGSWKQPGQIHMCRTFSCHIPKMYLTQELKYSEISDC